CVLCWWFWFCWLVVWCWGCFLCWWLWCVVGVGWWLWLVLVLGGCCVWFLWGLGGGFVGVFCFVVCVFWGLFCLGWV
ncbi:hypothetical protein, partial [Pseudomonas syringae group genomosp. 7]|uniref:hypothetical protein n=1 Tax=Pseudomonas syringae group genomosp. 7 TaxID=251699 RepID=UPI00377050FF